MTRAQRLVGVTPAQVGVCTHTHTHPPASAHPAPHAHERTGSTFLPRVPLATLPIPPSTHPHVLRKHFRACAILPSVCVCARARCLCADELGIPFAITLDFDTIGQSKDAADTSLKGTATLRDRDSCDQATAPRPPPSAALLCLPHVHTFCDLRGTAEH